LTEYGDVGGWVRETLDVDESDEIDDEDDCCCCVCVCGLVLPSEKQTDNIIDS